MESGIAFLGLFLIFALHHFRIGSSFLIAIFFCWILSVALKLSHFSFGLAFPSSLSPTLLQLEWAIDSKWFGTLISIVLIALFDSSASLTVLSRLSHHLDARGEIRNVDRIMLPDGLGSMLAAVLGTGTLTYSLESSAGIKVGGRGKGTAITAAFLCLACLFFFPLIQSIPLFATTPAILAIGCFMVFEIKKISWEKVSEWVPALISLITIPTTFSIYLGFGFGFVSYALLKALKREWKEVHPVCWTLAALFAVHFLWTVL